MKARGWGTRVVALVAVLVTVSQTTYAAQYSFGLLPSSFAESYAYGIGGGQAVGTAFNGNSLTSRAMLWTGTTINLHPTGYDSSIATGVGGGKQVGYGQPTNYSWNHALLWEGSAASVRDLTPVDYTQAFAYDIDGNTVVGMGTGPSTQNRAVLWNLPSGSITDLHPSPSSVGSEARAVKGNRQAGYAYSTTGNVHTPHAALWHGTAGSHVDLHPSGFAFSVATTVDDTRVAGYGYVDVVGQPVHALVWQDTAASAVDYTPVGFVQTIIEDSATGLLVGRGGGPATGANQFGGFHEHALLWTGGPQQYLDLHQFVPPQYSDSIALSVDAYGNVVGAVRDSAGHYHAAIWLPEPSVLGPAIISLMFMRRRR